MTHAASSNSGQGQLLDADAAWRERIDAVAARARISKRTFYHRFDDKAPLYMQVSRGGLSLHLSEHHGDATAGSTIFVRMTGVEALHREISATIIYVTHDQVEAMTMGDRIAVMNGGRIEQCSGPEDVYERLQQTATAIPPAFQTAWIPPSALKRTIVLGARTQSRPSPSGTGWPSSSRTINTEYGPARYSK